jgi:hypothetical protein
LCITEREQKYETYNINAAKIRAILLEKYLVLTLPRNPRKRTENLDITFFKVVQNLLSAIYMQIS